MTYILDLSDNNIYNFENNLAREISICTKYLQRFMELNGTLWLKIIFFFFK